MAVDLNQFIDPNDWMAGGFGLKAIERANKAGVSNAQIRAALSTTPGLTIGTRAGQHLGADTTLYGFQNQGGFGANSYAAARGAGYSDADIRSSLAGSGLTIYDKAAESLNVNPGYTYLGYAPKVTQSFAGNDGNMYDSRPQLAPRGFGLNNPTFSSQMGYSPTFYISGGHDDAHAYDFLFGGNAGAGGSIGGGYSDPGFHERNYIPPGQAIAMANMMSGRSGAAAPAAPKPAASYGSAGTTSNTATGVRAAGTPGSGTTYSSLNRAGSTGLTIGGLNV